MSIDISELSIDSRDYLSIYNDLVNAIPDVSQIWKSTDENDIGIILIKLMSMYGDMLSYNHDRAVLEVYPESVQQRKNAVQLFNLLGYKMHWYRSAVCKAYITNNSSVVITIPKYTRFSTIDNNIFYTYIGNKINGNASIYPSSSISSPVELELMQGIPYTPSYLENNVVIPQAISTGVWHSTYDYNLSSDDFVLNNRYYLYSQNIDETSITLVDNNGDEWKQVDNLNTQTNVEKMFALNVDTNGTSYIELCENWKTFNVSKFKLFYVITLGSQGSIVDNTIKSCDIAIAFNGNVQTNVSNQLSILNERSTYGYDPETADEAREEFSKYINTYDTLITIDDFTKAIKRINGIANCIVTDNVTDADPTGMEDNDIKVYLIPSDAYASMTQDELQLLVEENLENKKHIKINPTVMFNGISYYLWTLGAGITLKEKVSKSRSQEIIIKINSLLKSAFSVENMEFNTAVDYKYLIDLILSSDKSIKNVDLDWIHYNLINYDENGDIDSISDTNTPKDSISGKFKQIVQTTSQERESGIFTTTILNTPIRKGTVSISTSIGTITDNRNGTLMCNSPMFVSGTVNYTTGAMSFTLSLNDTGISILSYTVNYQQNVINMIKFGGVGSSVYILHVCSHIINNVKPLLKELQLTYHVFQSTYHVAKLDHVTTKSHPVHETLS